MTIKRLIPEAIQMRCIMLGDGKNGAAIHLYVNTEYKINLQSERPSRNMPFVETWSSEHLPEQSFKTFKELRQALLSQKID